MDVVGNVGRATETIPALERWGLLCCAVLWLGAVAGNMTWMTCRMRWMAWTRRTTWMRWMGVLSDVGLAE